MGIREIHPYYLGLDPLHAMAALSDQTVLSGMRQGINARLDRVAILLRPLMHIASSLQTHHLLLLCLFLFPLHLRPPAPQGAHRALPVPDPHGYGGRIAYQKEKEWVLLFKSFQLFLYGLQKRELLLCRWEKQSVCTCALKIASE